MLKKFNVSGSKLCIWHVFYLNRWGYNYIGEIIFFMIFILAVNSIVMKTE